MKVDAHSTIVDNTDYSHKQKSVDARFDAESTFWRDTYREKSVLGILYRQRQAIALSYVDGLTFPRSARVLEIGCGAGYMSIALAQRGFTVDAVDHVSAMIELTRRHARQAGMDGRIDVGIEDVHELTFADQSFDLVVALGVVTWLHDLRRALREITRVMTPRGYFVVSIDNRYCLQALLDPLSSPVFESVRKGVGGKLERVLLKRAGRSVDRQLEDAALAHPYSTREFSQYLRDANLANIKHTCLGFGPFKMLGHSIFSDGRGVKIQQKLQEYADSGYPILRSTGSQCIILARKHV